MKQESKDILQHYGVKGMRWGVRRNGKLTSASRKRNSSYRKGMKRVDKNRMKKITDDDARKKYLDDRDAKWLDKVKDDAKVQMVAKRTARDMKKVNKQLKKVYGNDFKRAFNRQNQAKFHNEMQNAYEEILADHTFAVYKMSPTRTREVEIKSLPNGTMKAVVIERNNPKLAKQRAAITKGVNKNIKREKKSADSLTHSVQNDASTNVTGMYFIITPDEDGFPDYVFDPFFLANDIKHSGVKGMKWGVRRDLNKSRNTIGDHLNSLKRERQWKKVLSEVDNLTTNEIKTVSDRIRLENQLKRLSRSKVANSNDKRDYLKRADLSDDELSNKVARLKAKDSLHTNIRKASKEQREFGEKIVKIGGDVALKYATKKTLTAQDIFDSITNPKSNIKDRAVRELVDSLTKKNKVKEDYSSNI